MGFKTFIRLLFTKHTLQYLLALFLFLLIVGGIYATYTLDQKLNTFNTKGTTAQPTPVNTPTLKMVNCNIDGVNVLVESATECSKLLNKREISPTIKTKKATYYPTSQPIPAPTNDLVDCWDKAGRWNYNFGVIPKAECDARVEEYVKNWSNDFDHKMQAIEDNNNALNESLKQSLEESQRAYEESNQTCLSNCIVIIVSKIDSGYYGDPNSEVTPEREAEVMADLEACKSGCK